MTTTTTPSFFFVRSLVRCWLAMALLSHTALATATWTNTQPEYSAASWSSSSAKVEESLDQTHYHSLWSSSRQPGINASSECGPTTTTNESHVPSGNNESNLVLDGSTFGVVQTLRRADEPESHDDQVVAAHLQETARYMRMQVQPPSLDNNDDNDCRNRHEDCTLWAVQGECQVNPNYMAYQCAPACQTCHWLLLEEEPDEAWPHKEEEDEEETMNPELETGDLEYEWSVSFGVAQHLLDATGQISRQRLRVQLEETSRYYRQLAQQPPQGGLDTDPAPTVVPCANHNPWCTLWSLRGECQRNLRYMTHNCAPACHVCPTKWDPIDTDHDSEQAMEDIYEEEEEGPGSDFGVVQVLSDLDSQDWEEEDEEDPMDQAQRRRAFAVHLKATQTYMTHTVWPDPAYESVWESCRNHHASCTEWAALDGTCTTHRGYMYRQCAPACLKCEMVQYQTRCAADPHDPNAWSHPGDLNGMFERIVSTYPNVTVVSQPRTPLDTTLPTIDDDNNNSTFQNTTTPLDGPWIVILDDFISTEEAEALILEGTQQGYDPSQGVGSVDEATGEYQEIVTRRRTSTNTWCEQECQANPLVAQVLDRLVQLTDLPLDHSESLQLLKCKSLCCVCILVLPCT